MPKVQINLFAGPPNIYSDLSLGNVSLSTSTCFIALATIMHCSINKKKYLYNNLRLPHEIPSETLSHLKLESNNQSRSTKVEKKIEKERIIKAKKNEANQDEPKQKTIQPESTLGDVGMLKTNQNNHDLAMEPCHWGPRPNPNP